MNSRNVTRFYVKQVNLACTRKRDLLFEVKANYMSFCMFDNIRTADLKNEN